MKPDYALLSDQEEHIAKMIVDAAFAVHKALGPGLLESVYEVCFCHELTKRGLSWRRQVDVPIVYASCLHGSTPEPTQVDQEASWLPDQL